MIVALIGSFFAFSMISGNNSFPVPLTADEERKCLEDLANGDLKAKDILVERNLRLVAHIVKKYSNYQKDSEDLISIGTIGLIKAVASFKTDKNTRLATYAARCIENEILMNIRSNKKYAGDISLQDVIGVDGEGNEVRIEDKVFDTSISVDEEVDLKLQIIQLHKQLRKTLKGRELLVIELRYGLLNAEEKTQREIADMLGISRSYVSRIEKKALKKLSKDFIES